MRSRPQPPPRQYNFKSFYGSSSGPVPTHYYGRIHGLPSQQGIPGFQRISFLRFQLTSEGEFDHGQIWGYEGCVLPGGQIIIGRWWHVSTDYEVEPIDLYSGPFIFWNVDNSSADIPIQHDAAMEFLSSLRDQGLGL